MRRIRKTYMFSIVLVLTFVLLICTGCGQSHLKQTCDKYESLADQYVEFVEKYGNNPEPGTYPESEFMELMEEWAEVNAEMKEIDTSDLSEEELQYFFEVVNRTSSKMEVVEDGNYDDGYDEDDEDYDDDESSADEFIFADSDSRYLTAAEIQSLDSYSIRLAKNEIYARYGRKFQDQELQSYFDSCSWYEGLIEPEDFDESVFNAYEKENIKMLVKYE